MTKKISQFNPYLAGIALSLLFIIWGIATLPDYGISWDAPFRMMRGQAYAHLYLDNKLTYDYPSRISPVLIKPDQKITRYITSAWEGQNPADLPERPLPQTDFKSIQQQAHLKTSFYEAQDWDGNYMIHEGVGHLPLIDTLSAFSNRFFYQATGILGDIESYQLIYILAAAVGIFVVTVFTFQITGSHFAAIVAGLSLALFPLFIGDSNINMKDPIQASFYAGAIWGFWNWIRTNKLRWFVIFGSFIVLALGVKWNVIFLPFVLLPWLLTIRKNSELKKWFRVKKLLFCFVALFIASCLFMILIWPNSWSDPINSLVNLVGFYWTRGTEANLQPDGFIGLFGFNFYPIILFLTQTPEVILLLILSALYFGIVQRFNDNRLKSSLLLVFWVFEPLIRYSLPHVATLLGLRQIMEMLPGMAILAGLGYYGLINLFRKKLSKVNDLLLNFIVLALIFIFLLIPIIQLHPNENTYFNSFTGGLNGAVNHNLVDWTLTYGNSYKQAALWLNQNAETNANIAFLDGSNFALSPLWLRNDISLSPNHFSGFDQKGEYLLVPLDSTNYPAFANRYPVRYLNPIHEIKVDGVAILKIYQNSPKFLKDGYQSEKLIKDATVTPYRIYNQKLLEIKLPAPISVTRVIIAGADTKCIKPPINDIFLFQSTSQIIKNNIDNNLLYVSPERKVIDNNHIQYSFPAEKSQYLSILLGETDSCFQHGKIEQIYGLDD